MAPTRDEILAEPAGPRLNQWVAEYVTHWQPSGLARDMSGNPFPEPMPDYSGDIAAAWQVVEKLGCGTIGHYPRGRWTAYFITQEDGILRHIAQAETAPLAICQAALLAVIG